jgi:hypothetical protein
VNSGSISRKWRQKLNLISLMERTEQKLTEKENNSGLYFKELISWKLIYILVVVNRFLSKRTTLRRRKFFRRSSINYQIMSVPNPWSQQSSRAGRVIENPETIGVQQQYHLSAVKHPCVEMFCGQQKKIFNMLFADFSLRHKILYLLNMFCVCSGS